MSSSNAASQDSSKASASRIPLKETQAIPLPPLASDPALLSLPSKHQAKRKYRHQHEHQHQHQHQQHQQRQPDVQIPHKLSLDGEPIYTDNVEIPIAVSKEEEGEVVQGEDQKLEVDDNPFDIDDNEDGSSDISPEDLALVCRTRRGKGGSRPGATRVLKRVRLRKPESSNKRRTKKHALRVQLQKSERIEEEIAQFRGKEKGRLREPVLPKPARRYVPDPPPGPRPPSSLRFSQSCHYSDDEVEVGQSTLPMDPKTSIEFNTDAPANLEAQIPQAA